MSATDDMLRVCKTAIDSASELYGSEDGLTVITTWQGRTVRLSWRDAPTYWEDGSLTGESVRLLMIEPCDEVTP